MQFSRDGEWYQVIRITGPSHNLLALRFGDLGVSGPEIEHLTVSNGAPVILAEAVQNQVLDGVAEANAELGTNYRVTGIRFVDTDTPSSDIYRTLANVIVKQAK